MTKRLAVIMQPTYLPWLGYFDLMDQADIFVYFDSVAYARRSWQQRNRIKTAQGELMLTVPVQKGERDQLISEVKIEENSKFQTDHLKAIKFSYAKAPYFQELMPELTELYMQPVSHLADFNIRLIEYFYKKASFPPKDFVRSSSLRASGVKVERLVQVCEEVGADSYLSALGSKEYIEENNLFEARGIALRYHNYVHPTYSQLHGAFLPYMSILDLLMNEGPDKAASIVRSGRQK